MFFNFMCPLSQFFFSLHSLYHPLSSFISHFFSFPSPTPSSFSPFFLFRSSPSSHPFLLPPPTALSVCPSSSPTPLPSPCIPSLCALFCVDEQGEEMDLRGHHSSVLSKTVMFPLYIFFSFLIVRDLRTMLVLFIIFYCVLF